MNRFIGCFFAILYLFLIPSPGQEMVSKRTLHTKTFKNQDNSFTTQIHIQPVHYFQNGAFIEIDNSIITSSTEYDLQVNQGTFNAYFSRSPNKEFPCVFERNGVAIRFGLEQMVYFDSATRKYHTLYHINRDSHLQTTKNRITYANVFPGVDWKLTCTPTQLKEEIILTQTTRQALPSPESYGINRQDAFLMFLQKIDLNGSMPASVGNLKIGRNTNTSVIENANRFRFKNLKGDTLFSMNASRAFVNDNRHTPPETLIKMNNLLFKDANGYYLLAGISYQNLQNLPKGNVIFDPSWELQPDAGQGKDVCIGSDYYKNTNLGTYPYLFVQGKTSNVWRTLLKFSDIQLDNVRVDQAILRLYQDYSGSGGGEVNVFPVTRSWKEGTGYISDNSSLIDGVTWLERWWGLNWNQPGGEYQLQAVGSKLCNVDDSHHDFVLDIDLVQDWIDNPSGNNGVLLLSQQELEGGSDYFVSFAASDHSTPEYRPQLILTYRPKPPEIISGTTIYIRGVDGQVISTYQIDD